MPAVQKNAAKNLGWHPEDVPGVGDAGLLSRGVSAAGGFLRRGASAAKCWCLRH
ncbi:hypothetical protein ACTXLI_12490 [Glutamicibacter arilaitensis]|uniref:hypothetical protein n=1 Tax=Glutamicibacter arilaitensis TaxID=256701 RepID=UPI003FD443A5